MKRFIIPALTLLIAFFSCSKPSAEQKKEFSPDATLKFHKEPVASFDGEGGKVDLTFTATGYWEVIISDKVKDWITVEPMSGDGSSSRQRIVITAAANNEDAARSGRVTLTVGEQKQIIPVSQDESVITITPEDVPNLDKIYIPQEWRSMDLYRSDSNWSFIRSRQSDHFIVFWGKGFGSHGTPTPSEAVNSSYRVNIDDLLAKAEGFYQLNINKLKFAEESKSVVSKYKMIICLNYASDWLATGSGYDNTIGALWVNPSSCQPVGSTIGHEIGHSFQYMVYCDYLLNNPSAKDDSHGPGYRYGYGANGDGGNAFWEQTAQWQSFQIEDYRPEAFYGWYGQFPGSINLHVLHERPRYANYFLHWWWVEQNDITFIGRLWREAEYPEDPVETYMRLMNYDVSALNDSMWSYAAHMVTYDTDEIRDYGKNYIGDVATASITKTGDWWGIDASVAPESTGSNVIRMNVNAGSQVSVTLASNLGLPGCISGNASKAGWRYGFVTLNSDNTRTYSPIWKATDSKQTWTVPSNAKNMWLVVTGAPTEYMRHPWGSGGSDHDNEGDSQDVKWPWKAQFENTKPYEK